MLFVAGDFFHILSNRRRPCNKSFKSELTDKKEGGG